jgi:hypothetical protein
VTGKIFVSRSSDPYAVSMKQPATGRGLFANTLMTIPDSVGVNSSAKRMFFSGDPHGYSGHPTEVMSHSRAFKAGVPVVKKI